MTGFGKASGGFQSKKVSVEIRSLNSKSVDLMTRVPSQYKELDGTFRKVIAEELGRGKIDLQINIESNGEESSVTINRPLAKSYYNDLKALSAELGEEPEDLLALVLRMPDIYNSEKEELSEDEKEWVLNLLKEAIAKLDHFRQKEGAELAQEFTERIEDIRRLLSEVPQYEEERITTIRERMRKGLEDIESGNYDDNRFEQEMIFYIEKLDISEEKMRLANHLDYFQETMRTDEAGKKLGFIAQEIGREINTLGSKSNHAAMQKLVIDMKDNLEKIKEQILNTL
jgi:uncharacterized protein (TIGR00255 family)